LKYLVMILYIGILIYFFIFDSMSQVYGSSTNVKSRVWQPWLCLDVLRINDF